MRGALVSVPWRMGLRRIIPADAGSTVAIVQICEHFEDHPRGCGEHTSHPYA